MKIKFILFSGLLFASFAVRGQGVLSDNFNGTAVDTNVWRVVLPESDSSVTENNGLVYLENAGRLVSQTSLPQNYNITGSFMMTGNPFSNFKIMLRTDGVSNPFYPYTTVHGIEIQFNVEDDNGVLSNNIKILNAMPGAGVELGVVSANLTLNSLNTFSITDDGNNIAVYFDGSATPNLTVQSTYGVGNQIALLTREGGAAGSGISANGITQLDYLNVQTVPEPSTAAMIGMGIISLIGIRRKMKQIY